MKQSGYYLQIPPQYHAGGLLSPSPGTPGESWGEGYFEAPVKSIIGWFFGLILLVAIGGQCRGSVLAPTTQPVSVENRIDLLIDQLSSDDAAARQAAARALTNMGSAARPAILKAVQSDDPGLRQQAAQILVNLPWYAPDDPPIVRKILQQYGEADIDLRRQVVDLLASLDNDQGIAALSRLVAEDPSPEVQWAVVTSLRERNRIERFREIQPPTDNSRILALCGYARLDTAPAAAVDLLQRCAKLEIANPTDDDGEFDYVIRFLADEACREKQFDQAADWRRKEWMRGSTPDENGTPLALLELFALHADFGPLKGLDDDIRLAAGQTQQPKIAYALAEMYARNSDSEKAETARKNAFAASSTRIQRYNVSEFLFDHGWDDLARGELEGFLKLPADENGIDTRKLDVNVHFRLGELAIRRGDDKTAADENQTALLGMDKNDQVTSKTWRGRETAIPITEMWADVYWRYLRAAVKDNNEHEINRRIEQLLELKPTDDEIAIDVIPLLQQRGRTIDANLLFGWAFDAMKKQLDSDPKNPDNLNGIAWLCAECDRNLPDAKRWAEQAAALMPNNAAILDTLADVNFRMGHAKEAFRLETQASSLDPDDPFMKKQVARFKAAAATQP